jgi:hypothetical protein
VQRRLKLGTRTLAGRTVRCFGAHTATVKLKPSKTLARALTKGRGSVKATLTVRMADFGQPARTVRRTITLRR